MAGAGAPQMVDAVVIGSGFSGLYMLKRLRDNLGLRVQVFEAGADVGGTWYWNRYPGARCDSEAYVYCFSFDDELLQEWNWSGKYPLQPEILDYLQHVADRYELRSDIQLETRVTAARFDEASGRWEVRSDRDDRLSAQFLITAVGALSAGQVPDIPGLQRFAGDWYHTSRWPHEGVDLAGKRVGVVGTGSSGVQTIPVIARQALALTVFQRTPQFMVPARHQTVDRQTLDDIKSSYDEVWAEARNSLTGFPYMPRPDAALDLTDRERQQVYEAAWAEGGLRFSGASFRDLATDRRANDTAAEFIRKKIRETVRDFDTAEMLLPRDHPFASKRALIDTGYFETYNRDNVSLVDVRHSPIEEITPAGIRTSEETYELDIIVFATGFDALTGSLNKIDIRGRGGQALREHWVDGPRTYLGLSSAGFPNLFMITGPGSPSVLTNMPVSIEQHVEWISDFVEYMRDRGLAVAEADAAVEAAWTAHVDDIAYRTLLPLADSFYRGANVPGKPDRFMPYAGGAGSYRKRCDAVAAAGYDGYLLTRGEALTGRI